MSQAFIWTELDNVNGTTVINPEIPYVDFGNFQASLYSDKKIVQLKWINSSVEDIKLWIDTYIADVYRDANTKKPELRQNIYNLGYRIKYCLLDSIEPITLPAARTISLTNLPNFASNVIDQVKDTHDGITLNVGDNILVASQTTKAENGLYTVDLAYPNSTFKYNLIEEPIQRGRIVNVVNASATDNGKSYFMYANDTATEKGPGSTSNYVAGLSVKWIERTTRRTLTNCVAATTLINRTTNSITDFNNAPTSLDGQVLALNNRILVKDQWVNPSQNGIYSVSQLYAPNTNKVTNDFKTISINNNIDNQKRVGINILKGTTYGGKTFRYYSSGFQSSTTLNWTDATAYFSSTITVKISISFNFGTWSPTSITNAPNVISGVSLINGDVILVRSTTNEWQNGIYNVQVAGTGSDGIWVRNVGFDTTAEIVPTIVYLTNGTNSFGGNFYYMTRKNESFSFLLNSANTKGEIAIYDRLLYPFRYQDCSNRIIENVNLAGAVSEKKFEFSNIQNGQRVIVNSQTTKGQNGIYTTTFASSANELVYSSDYTIQRGMYATITSGSQSTKKYLLYAPGTSSVPGSTNITWIDYSTPALLTARVASIDNLTGYTSGNFNNVTSSISGITVRDFLNNDKILLRSQTNKNENGLYRVNGAPTPGSSVLTRNAAWENLGTTGGFSRIAVEQIKGTNHGRIYLKYASQYSNQSITPFSSNGLITSLPYLSTTVGYYYIGAAFSSGGTSFTDGFGVVRSISNLDTILVKDTTNPHLSGIYINNAGVWTRNSPYDTITTFQIPTKVNITNAPTVTHKYMAAKKGSGTSNANNFLLNNSTRGIINIYDDILGAGENIVSVNETNRNFGYLSIDRLQDCKYTVILEFNEQFDFDINTENAQLPISKLIGSGTPTPGDRVLVVFSYGGDINAAPPLAGNVAGIYTYTGTSVINGEGGFASMVKLSNTNANDENIFRIGTSVKAPYSDVSYGGIDFKYINYNPEIEWYCVNSSGNIHIIPSLGKSATYKPTVIHISNVINESSCPATIDGYSLLENDTVFLATQALGGTIPLSGVYNYAFGPYVMNLVRDSSYTAIAPIEVTVGGSTVYRSYYDPASTILGTSNIEFLASALLKDKSVRVGSTTNITTSTPPSVIDTITLAVGDLVLLKNQSTATQNGIYLYDQIDSYNLTRSTDLDNAGEIYPFSTVNMNNNGLIRKYELCVPNGYGSYVLGTTAIDLKDITTEILYANHANVVSASNITSLTAGVPDTIDSIDLTLETNPYILLSGQTTSSERSVRLFERGVKQVILSRVTTGNVNGDQFSIEPLQVTVTSSASGQNVSWELFFDSAATTVGSSNNYWMRSNTWASTFANVDTTSSTSIDLTLAASGTLNGVAISENLRVLIKAQTTGSENGIYKIGYQRNLKLIRHERMNETSDLNSLLRVQVLEGSSNANKYFGIWMPTSSPVLNSTSIYWVEQGSNLRLNNCKVATTTAVSNLTTAAPLAVDGVSLVYGDRVLVKNQASAVQNGVYFVDNPGTANNGRWLRVAEMDANSEIYPGIVVGVDLGTVNTGKEFMISLPQPAESQPFYTIGSSNINWTEGNGFASYSTHPSLWNDFPTNLSTAIPLGKAILNKANEAKATRIGIAAYIPNGQSAGLVRNIKFITQYKPSL
jgi:hypothetical protein